MPLPNILTPDEVKQITGATSVKSSLPDTLSPDEVKSLGGQSLSSNQPPQPTLTSSYADNSNDPWYERLAKGAIRIPAQIGSGIGSAIGSAGLNLGKTALKVSSPVANLLGVGQENQQAQNAVDTINKKVFQEPVKTELNTTGGQIGNLVGQTAPYIATGGAISAISNATTGAKVFQGAGALPAIGRVAAGALAEGGANAATGYALSGGDTKQAITQGITAGALKGMTGALGEIANAGKLPQRMLASVYKTNKNSVAKIFDEANTPKEGNTQPLSQWALDKGLKGSLESQALKVRSILTQSEDKVIASAEASKVKIPVEQNLFKLAQGIQTDFQSVGRGEIAKKADQFLRSVKDNSVTLKDAIQFKRLLTNTLQSKSALNNPTLIDNLSYWAADLTQQINNVDKLGEINKDYSQAMKARQALINAATAQGNQKALGALESYAIGGGIIAGEPLSGAMTVGVKRALQSPNVTSRIAQGIKNLPNSSAAGSITRSMIGNQLGSLNTTQ